MTTKTINQEFEQCHEEMDLRKDLEGEYRSDHTDDCYRSFLAGRVSGISYCSDRDKARVDTKDAFPAYTRPPALKLIDSADLAEIRKEYRLNGAITIDGTLKLIKGVQHAFCKKNGLSLEAQK